jgi:hypothetical protein
MRNVTKELLKKRRHKLNDVLIISATELPIGRFGGGFERGERKVKAGELGRKTGRGWYEDKPDGSRKEK